MTTRRTFLRLLGIGAPAAALGATAKPQVVSGFPSGGGQPIPDGPVEIYPSDVNNAARLDPWWEEPLEPILHLEADSDAPIFKLIKRG